MLEDRHCRRLSASARSSVCRVGFTLFLHRLTSIGFCPFSPEQVVIYAKSWCGHCKKAKELLAKDEFKDVDIVIHDIDKEADGPAVQRALVGISNQTSVPQIFIGGEFLGGNDKLQEAYTNNNLQEKIAA
ncbi:MAG: hypothetical protein SGARI_004249 [Bacillariaceae sp.]